jgi:hypothetical protein
MSYIAKKVDFGSRPIEELSAFLDSAQIPFTEIGVVNWAEYPAKPLAQFRIAHTGSVILVNYHVEESCVRAEALEDGGKVWLDSCVELFLQPPGDTYYNIECNCIGTVRMHNGTGRHERSGDDAHAGKVQRFSTLGHRRIPSESGHFKWEISLGIPASALFNHQIANFDGQEMKANVYKCGDELETPHFLTWNPIKVEKPDFHRPEFFGKLIFE